MRREPVWLVLAVLCDCVFGVADDEDEAADEEEEDDGDEDELAAAGGDNADSSDDANGAVDVEDGSMASETGITGADSHLVNTTAG